MPLDCNLAQPNRCRVDPGWDHAGPRRGKTFGIRRKFESKTNSGPGSDMWVTGYPPIFTRLYEGGMDASSVSTKLKYLAWLSVLQTKSLLFPYAKGAAYRKRGS